MNQFNLFEPDLELGHSLIPYDDMAVNGVWPRKQRTPSDVFPTYSALVGRDPKFNARWLPTDENGVLLTNSVGGGGGGGVTPVKYKHWSDSVTSDSGHITQSGYIDNPSIIYAVGYYATPISTMPINSSYVGEFLVILGSDGSPYIVNPFLTLPPKLTYTGLDLNGGGKPYVEGEYKFNPPWDCSDYLVNGRLYCYIRVENYNLETDVHVYYV